MTAIFIHRAKIAGLRAGASIDAPATADDQRTMAGIPVSQEG